MPCVRDVLIDLERSTENRAGSTSAGHPLARIAPRSDLETPERANAVSPTKSRFASISVRMEW